MTNFKKRLILTLTCIPVMIFTLFFPQNTHILIILVYGILVTIIGSYEINSLIYHKGIEVRRIFLPIVNCSIFVFACLYAGNYFGIQNFKPALPLFGIYVISIISFIYARDILKKDLAKSFEKMSYTLFGLLYIGVPSFFFPFLFNISTHPENPGNLFLNIDTKGTLAGSFIGLYYITIVWTSDIFAYVFGMAFGRNNVISLASSPKKSWAGYIGGYLSTFVFVIAYYLLFNKYIEMPFWFYFSVPVLSGILVPIGDLVESVFKRSANIKDSGDVIMGRGGILDSVDSILYLLPIFFLLIQVYFSFTQL
jgi:phosphatidate cytidylyltransferase